MKSLNENLPAPRCVNGGRKDRVQPLFGSRRSDAAVGVENNRKEATRALVAPLEVVVVFVSVALSKRSPLRVSGKLEGRVGLTTVSSMQRTGGRMSGHHMNYDEVHLRERLQGGWIT